MGWKIKQIIRMNRFLLNVLNFVHAQNLICDYYCEIPRRKVFQLLALLEAAASLCDI